MAKTPIISGNEAAKAFEKDGWIFDRQTGSHMIYIKHDETKHLSIPKHKTLKIGTLRKLIKAAGLTTEKFEDLR